MRTSSSGCPRRRENIVVRGKDPWEQLRQCKAHEARCRGRHQQRQRHRVRGIGVSELHEQTQAHADRGDGQPSAKYPSGDPDQTPQACYEPARAGQVRYGGDTETGDPEHSDGDSPDGCARPRRNACLADHFLQRWDGVWRRCRDYPRKGFNDDCEHVGEGNRQDREDNPSHHGTLLSSGPSPDLLAGSRKPLDNGPPESQPSLDALDDAKQRGGDSHHDRRHPCPDSKMKEQLLRIPQRWQLLTTEHRCILLVWRARSRAISQVHSPDSRSARVFPRGRLCGRQTPR